MSLSSLEDRIRVCPPIDGHITLPETLAFHEEFNEDVPMYVYSKDKTEGLAEISYGQFIRASRRVPQVLGLHGDSSAKPVVALIALVDTLIYQSVLVGLMNAGFIPFPISPRNSAPAVANLIKKTSCHYVLATCATLKTLLDKVENEIETIEHGYKLTIREIPTLLQLFPELSDKLTDLGAPPKNDVKPVLDDVALYLHSSGSTGLPKAIPKTHREILEFVTFPSSVYFRDHRNPRARMASMHLPPFHAMGLYFQAFLPLFACITIALYPPTIDPKGSPPIPTPQNVLEYTKQTHCNVLIAVPALLQVWAQNEKSIELLSRMIQVRFAGGALSPKIGKLLVAYGVQLKTSYGGTEFGAPASSSLRPGDEDDWEYVEFTDKTDVRWIPQGDGTYECQFLICDTHHASIQNLLDVQGYATSDLFVPHPTKSYLWKIVGRIDDVIIHSSGEKTVPPPMEDIYLSSPHITAAVMFGHAHDQPGVLIEPYITHHIDISNEEEVAKLRNLIWPVIEEANQIAPAFSKVFKELILITDPRKPLPRAAKGTVMRKSSLNLYKEEIEKLYASVEFLEATEAVNPPDIWRVDDLTRWILDQVTELCSGKTIASSANLFQEGFDSLSATILRRRITGALQSIESNSGAAALKAIMQNTVYNYPTADSLARHIVGLLADPSSAGDATNRVQAIERMIAKYSFGNNALSSRAQQGDNTVVLITGTTGHLGSHILAGLLGDSRVSAIYALNRPSTEGLSAGGRHIRSFLDKGLDERLLTSSKLTYLESHYEEQNLGLSGSVYTKLSAMVTIVIHAAWRLDFNLSLASFESNVQQTYNLIELLRTTGKANIKFVFTSSVATAQSWDKSNGPYPEDVVFDARHAVGTGYGESKYVAERILNTSCLNSTSLRIGQITGSQTNGAWATTDWVPILVKSSMGLGAIPLANGNVSWISVDAVSNIIQELVFYKDHYHPALNIVHPTPTPWNLIVECIKTALEIKFQTSLPLVSIQEWFVFLEEKCARCESEDIIKIPAMKLRDFFQRLSNGDLNSDASTNGLAFGSTTFSVNQMTELIQWFGALPPLAPDDVKRWIEYWNKVGYFD